ncbi:uncharacterized protein LOC128985459 [Macrosteles quadrilineatus]|uniref:uncharacterized protein LOC128985459 n=1 Tax=Macrosteles quadrilineatus TaxID=74068 RepID=UPI0023E16FFF|nr:uncharacterized protein LOC128985459 [Macrosteles quadrilineatus]
MTEPTGSEDDFIDDIMNQLMVENTVRLVHDDTLNQELDTGPTSEEDQVLTPHLFEENFNLIEADVVLEDGLNISDVVGQQIILTEDSFEKSANNNIISDQQVDVKRSSKCNINNTHRVSPNDFDDMEEDPDDPDFIFPASDGNSSDSEHSRPTANSEDTGEQNVTIETNQRSEENQRTVVEEFGDLSENNSSQDAQAQVGRKRKRSKKAVPSEWEVNRNKHRRMTGQTYTGFTRRMVGDKIVVKKGGEKEERKLGPKCNSKICNANKKRRCGEFSEEDRKSIFKNFWDLSWNEKKLFVNSFITRTKPKRRTIGDPGNSRRKGTFTYFLRLRGENKQVCKKFFLNTLALKEWMTHNWLDKEDSVLIEEAANENLDLTNTNNNANDGSRHGRRSEKEKVIEEWLDSLPKVPSHYCRKSSKKLYLEPVWESKKAMFNEFKKYAIANQKPWGSITLFMSVFERKNLSIYVPKKDQCDVCSSFKVGNISKETYDNHLKEKERARDEKERDKQRAIAEEIYCLTVDVEAVKLTPLTRASAMYYKTKLCSHNYTVYNLATKHCTCYWFNEVEGDLSANTFATCITDYLKEHCLSPIRPIIIYSDGATNQNRNQILANALLHFAVQNNVQVSQKFLIKGHTHMEGDFVHAKIEERLKGKEVYVPHEFVKYTQEARQKPFPYNTKYLTHDFFKDFSKLSYYDSIRPGRTKGDPVVVDIHCLQYDPKEVRIKYKLNFDEELQDLPRRPAKVGKDMQPSQLFKHRLPLTESKWKHLQELKTVIPSDYHQFYDSLPYKKA